ncbi:MAG: hypothetical protein NTV71_01665 [Candidatus Omnitrophica bacterium]|nr:hypothetical protein [Candidatus Omnitrophota bacterium]
MKKIFCFAILACFVVSMAFAGETPAKFEKTLMLKGYIIDNKCASSQNKNQLSDFVKTHTKECALLPKCAASGYSIFSDGKLLKFDKASSAKVEIFLKRPDSKLQVMVTAELEGKELGLISIENQQ